MLPLEVLRPLGDAQDAGPGTPRRLRRALVATSRVDVLSFGHLVGQVLAPVHGPATETEAARADAQVPPVAQCGHRSAEERRSLVEGQQVCRRRLLVSHDRALPIGVGFERSQASPRTWTGGSQLLRPPTVPTLLPEFSSGVAEARRRGPVLTGPVGVVKGFAS